MSVQVLVFLLAGLLILKASDIFFILFDADFILLLLLDIILQIWGEPADGTLFVFQVLLIDDDQNDHDSQKQSNDSHDPDFEQLVIDDQHVARNSA